MKKKIAVVLRADFALGTGHLMRVKTLLNIIKDDFDFYLFATHFDNSLIPQASEYKTLECGSVYNLEQSIKKLRPDGLIIDHYFLDYDFEAKFYDTCKVIVIDDLADRKHKAHILIDPYISHTKDTYRNLVNADCLLYTGQDYALIRDEFVKNFIGFKRKADNNVLIAYGGADPAHATLKLIKSIVKSQEMLSFNFTVLTGSVNQDYDDIVHLCKYFKNIQVMRHSDDVPALLLNHTLSFGAYGGMFSERIIARIPSVCTSIAQNQDKGRDIINNIKVGINLDLAMLENTDEVVRALYNLKEHYAFYVSNCIKVFDGNSSLRIRQIIDNLFS